MGVRVPFQVPWWAKVALKVAVFYVPMKNVLFRAIGFFRHGDMAIPQYATGVFLKHLNRTRSSLPSGYSVLELGPGDSLSTAVVAYAFGASETTMVDVAPFAHTSIAVYHRLIHWLAETPTERDVRHLLKINNVSDLMAAVNGRYLSNGLVSLKTLPDNHFDLCFSNAVLEHVYLNEVEPFITGVFRTLKAGGVTSHTIDFEDHLAHSLHSLQFSPKVWESTILKNAGFYTNRIRMDAYCEVFSRVGFRIEQAERLEWAELPVSRQKLHPLFRNRQDLLVRRGDVVASKP